MRIVTNKELSTYKVLPFDLYSDDKGKILEAGEVLTPGKLIMLKNYVKIYTEEYTNVQEPDKVTLVKQDKTFVKENFEYDDAEAESFDTVVNRDSYVKTNVQCRIKWFYKKILNLLIHEHYEDGLIKLNTLVDILKSEVIKQVGKTGKGSKVRFFGEYELCHPLNVAIISGLIAKKLDYSPIRIEYVMLAGLLHDVGKLRIELTNSDALLTTNEEEVIKHPNIGYKMLKDNFDLPEEIAKVALEHHENNDGSGYPKGLSNDYISEYSQIVNVANFYDNLASNRTHFNISNNKEALRTMLEVGTKKFSAQMLYTFIHMFNYDDAENFNDMML